MGQYIAHWTLDICHSDPKKKIASLEYSHQKLLKPKFGPIQTFGMTIKAFQNGHIEQEKWYVHVNVSTNTMDTPTLKHLSHLEQETASQVHHWP